MPPSMHSAGVAGRSPALAEYDSTVRPASAYSSSAGILAKLGAGFSNVAAKCAKAEDRCPADDDEDWSLSGWDEGPSVPDSARVASAKLSKHTPAALSDTAPGPISRTAASAKASGRASPCPASKASLAGAATTRSTGRQATSNRALSASAVPTCAFGSRVKAASRLRHAVQRERLKQQHVLGAGEESDGETAEEEHYRPMNTAAAVAGMAAAASGCLDSCQTTAQLSAQAEPVTDADAAAIADLQPHGNLCSTTDIPAGLLQPVGVEDALQGNQQRTCQQDQQQLQGLNTTSPSTCVIHQGLMATGTRDAPGSKALRPTLSFGGGTCSLQGCAGRQQQQQQRSVSAGSESTTTAMLGATPAGCSCTDLQAQQQMAAAGSNKYRPATSSSSMQPQLGLSLTGSSSSPVRGTLHLGSTFRRMTNQNDSVVLSVSAAAVPPIGDDCSCTTKSLAVPEQQPMLTLQQLLQKRHDSLLEQQQQRPKQELLRIVSLGRQAGSSTNNSSDADSMSCGVGGSCTPGDVAACARLAGDVPPGTLTSSTEHRITTAKDVKTQVCTTVSSAICGYGNTQPAGASSTPISSCGSAADMHPRRNLSAYPSGNSNMVLRAGLTSAAPGATSAARGSICTTSHSSHSNKAATTTTLAVKAQLLLSKDLTSLSPRTPRYQDPFVQQQQEQEKLAAVGLGCSNSNTASSRPCTSIGPRIVPAVDKAVVAAAAAIGAASRPVSAITGPSSLAFSLGSGPLARQLQSQGLAAAAEYQKARAAVDGILESITTHRISRQSSTDGPVAAALSDAAATGAVDRTSGGSGCGPSPVPVFRHCRSLKAYEEFQCSATPLPDSILQPATGSTVHANSNKRAGANSPTNTAAVASGGAGRPRTGLVAASTGSRVHTAAGAAAKAAQQAGLKLVGSPASRTSAPHS